MELNNENKNYGLEFKDQEFSFYDTAHRLAQLLIW